MIFKNGIYYLANGRPKTNANNIFTISFSTNGNFTVMSICYLISSRSDIVIGAFIADTTDPQ